MRGESLAATADLIAHVPWAYESGCATSRPNQEAPVAGDHVGVVSVPGSSVSRSTPLPSAFIT